MTDETNYDGLLIIARVEGEDENLLNITQALSRDFSSCLIDFKTTKTQRPFDEYEMDWTSLKVPESWSPLLPAKQNRLATIAILAHFARGHLFTKRSGR